MADGIVIVYVGFPHRGGGVSQHIVQLRRWIPAFGYGTHIVSLSTVHPLLRFVPHAVQLLINRVSPPWGYYLRYRIARALLRRAVRNLEWRNTLRGVIFEDIYITFPTRVPAVTVLHALQSDNLQSHRLARDVIARVERYEAGLLQRIPCPVVTVSEEYRRSIEAKLGEYVRGNIKMGVIPLGVTASDFPFPPAVRPTEPLRLIYAGKLEPRKNVYFLVDLVSALQTTIGPFTLSIAGDGSLRARLQAAFANRGLHRHVQFLGYVPNPQLIALLQTHNVLVHPSRKESFAQSLLEGKLAGLRVLVTEGLDVPDEFSDFRLPLNVGAWADAIKGLLPTIGHYDRQFLAHLQHLRTKYDSQQMTRDLISMLDPTLYSPLAGEG